MTPAQIQALPYRPCVGLCLTNAAGLIWAGERIDTPGAWQMPQGGVDPGETPQVAALRELGEEIGLAPEHVEIIGQTSEWLPYDLPHHLVPKLWKGRFRGQEQKWFRLTFTGPETAITINTEQPEFAHWRWIAADDLLDAIVPFKRDLYRVVLAEFGLI